MLRPLSRTELRERQRYQRYVEEEKRRDELLSYGLSQASVNELTEPEHWERAITRMETERDHNEDVCDHYGDLR